MAMEGYEIEHSESTTYDRHALAPDDSLYSAPNRPDVNDQALKQEVVDSDLAERINYDAAENRKKINATPAEKPADSQAVPEEKPFYGIDLPFLKLGVSDWSLKFGADVGIAKFGTSLGKQTGAEAGAGIPGLVYGDGHAGVSVSENGLSGRAGAQGDFLKNHQIGIGASGSGGFDVGNKTGAFVDQNARALGAHQSLSTGAYVGKEGLKAGYDVNAGFAHTIGANNGLNLALGPDSSIEKKVGLYAGSANVGVGAGIDSGGNEFIRPNVHVEGGLGQDKGRADLGAQIGPGADVSIGAGYDHIDAKTDVEKGKEAIASAGMGGLGAKIIDKSSYQKFDGGKVGFGEQYSDPAPDPYSDHRMVEDDRKARASEQESWPVEDCDVCETEPVADQGKVVEAAPQADQGKVEAAPNQDCQPTTLPPLDLTDVLEPVTEVFHKGETIYDIARRELVARSQYTRESVDNDSIFRECNRIMVNSGFPDAHLEGKSNISMANLPRAWNSIRNGQVLTIYSAGELNK